MIHIALPSTVEGYYQEIGRAGRDGLPARALLYYSWADRKMHESFQERDFPPAPVLEALLEKVPAEGCERSALLASCGLRMEIAEPALGKLWVHGGVTVDSADRVRRGSEGWRASYEAIRAYRVAQLDEVVDFAQSSGCRMARLVRYFGESRDTRSCGICDACRPHQCVARCFREAHPAELSLSERILAELERRDGLASGTLLRNLVPSAGPNERKAFDQVLGALERAGALLLRDDAFEKDGKTIRFRRANLKPNARGALKAELLLFDDTAPSGASQPRKRKPKGKAKTGATRAVLPSD